MGLYSRNVTPYEYTVVQYSKLVDDRVLFVRHGGYDYSKNVAQRYCPLQPGKVLLDELYRGWLGLL